MLFSKHRERSKSRAHRDDDDEEDHIERKDDQRRSFIQPVQLRAMHPNAMHQDTFYADLEGI